MNNILPPETPKGQRDAVTANDATITVEAGAGTGKTWVLSQRYLNLLLNDDELLPADILTLTFTEAAAGEMKERIEQLITQSLHLFRNNERKQKILDGLSDSWISTIHSFAGRLIRESGLSLDIDPMAAVIHAHEEQSFWEDIKNAAEFAGLGRLAQNYTGGEILTSAKSLDNDEYMNAAVGKWGAGTLANFARNVAELHASSGCSWRNMLEWANDDSGLIHDSGLKVMALLREEWRLIWNLWQKIRLDDVKSNDMAGNSLNNFLDALRTNPPASYDSLRNFYVRIVTDENIAGRTKVFSQLKDYLDGLTFGAWRKKQREGIVFSITENFTSELTPQEHEMRKTLLKFCAVSWGIWDNMKTKRGLLSFSDMILHARSTIANKGIRKTFKHILVDEFQDTDPLQFGMIESLKKYGENSRLFAVGDPKQSIYKFRHADPKLFADIMREPDTRKISLDTSFRTRASLLAKINAMFKNLWPDGISREKSMSEVKYNALSPVNDVERESGTMPDFRVYLLRNNNGADAGKKALASDIAAKISSWVKSCLTIWDKKDKIIRPVNFSDFAILSRSRGCFSVLEEALERFGIPSIQDRSTEYFSRGEIGDVVCTLRAAADFTDDFSVMGWLMSPFSGVSEDDAVKCLTLADENHRPIDLIRENFPGAYSRLEYLSVVGENEGASGILAFYDRKRDWLSCSKDKDKLRVLRNVRLALRIAREFQSSSSSLVSCAEYMTRSIRNKAQYEEPAWHDDSENAVKLGAVHSAKGLEYPVTVIFADRVMDKRDSDSLKPSKDLGLVASKMPDEVSPARNFTSKLNQWHKLLSEQGDSEEEERLFYVACTRAQDSLIFCGLIRPVSTKTQDSTPAGYAGQWSEFLLKSIEGMNDVTPEILSGEGISDEQTAGGISESKTLVPVETVTAERALRQISATSFALYEFCPYAWRRKYRQGLTLTWELPDRDNDSDDDIHGGAALGSLAHWILSRWPKSDDYESELDTLLYERDTLGLLPGYLRDTWRHCDKDTLRKWLMRFAESDLGVKLRNEPGLKREYMFRVPLDGDTVMAGSVDAVYGDCVVDYKITAADEVPEGLYDSQLDFYAYIVHEKTKAESVNATIAFIKENTSAERVITNFDSIRERIEKAAKKCASGNNESYNANHKNCRQCPFKKGCVKIAGTIQE